MESNKVFQKKNSSIENNIDKNNPIINKRKK